MTLVFQGQVALVTGASKGIGAEAAKALGSARRVEGHARRRPFARWAVRAGVAGDVR